MNKSTNIDFHLAAEETPSGGALLIATWHVKSGEASLHFSAEMATANQVASAIALMSKLQETITGDVYEWGKTSNVPT